MTIIAFVVITAASLPFILSIFQDPAYFSPDVVARRQLSNELRLEMANYAFDRIIERPMTGYGSWSNPMDFVSALQPDSSVVVHSFFLQFGYEYGVVGIGIVVFLLYISLKASWRLLDRDLVISKRNKGLWLVCWFCWALFVFNLFMGGLSGYTRITQGLAAGLLLFTASSPLLKIAFVDRPTSAGGRSRLHVL